MSTETASGSGPDIESWVLPMPAHTEDNTSDPSKPSSSTKDSSILMDAINRQQYPVHPLYGPHDGAMIPTEGPATEPDGPRTYTYIAAPNSVAFTIPPSPATDQQQPNPSPLPNNPALASDLPAPETSETGRSSQPPEASTSQGGVGANHYPSSSGVPRLPPILQVEKQQVTTSATQVASANRRRNEAHFQCPVPGCGSTFTRRFNLRGHLRSHTEERPYVCQWPGCKKGFARQHDCKRHQALHTAKAQANVCQGCKKTFSRLDALNRHRTRRFPTGSMQLTFFIVRSDGGADCRRIHEAGMSEKKQGSAGVSGENQVMPMPMQTPDVVMSPS
ncbi:hypothetical protein BDZ89DRAFT_1005783 [Hymenopellis radicata]|nr:hypothetical protein BDZ89DRAFT_1005783 [Hymenopellis radicata]